MIKNKILNLYKVWKNVELAMVNLRKAKTDTLKGISKLSKNKLAPFIRSSGFYKQKADRLIGLAKFTIENGGVKKLSRIALSDLRLALCDLKGVGPETADSILLYALGKPVFVIDEYTRRLTTAYRLQATAKSNYEKLRELFEKNLPRDWRLYQDFHALIVIDGKRALGRTL